MKRKIYDVVVNAVIVIPIEATSPEEAELLVKSQVDEETGETLDPDVELTGYILGIPPDSDFMVMDPDDTDGPAYEIGKLQ